MIRENGMEKNAAYDLEDILKALRDFAHNHQAEINEKAESNIAYDAYAVLAKLVIPLGKPEYNWLNAGGKGQ